MNQFPGVPIRLLCDRHLLGVHGESHKFLSHWRKRASASGWIRNDCIEPEHYKMRHDEAAKEMTARGMNHQSELDQPDFSYLPEDDFFHRAAEGKNRLKLMNRCWECRQRLIKRRA